MWWTLPRTDMLVPVLKKTVYSVGYAKLPLDIECWDSLIVECQKNGAKALIVYEQGNAMDARKLICSESQEGIETIKIVFASYM